VVEQDHRAIKRITRPMLGFKDFRCARIILSGIEVMHMIRKGQMKTEDGTHPSAAEQFYSMVMWAVLLILGLLIKMVLSRHPLAGRS
jgi:putative transposase